MVIVRKHLRRTAGNKITDVVKHNRYLKPNEAKGIGKNVLKSKIRVEYSSIGGLTDYNVPIQIIENSGQEAVGEGDFVEVFYVSDINGVKSWQLNIKSDDDVILNGWADVSKAKDYKGA